MEIISIKQQYDAYRSIQLIISFSILEKYSYYVASIGIMLQVYFIVKTGKEQNVMIIPLYIRFKMKYFAQY